jgi:nucleoid-associated protein YgaU
MKRNRIWKVACLALALAALTGCDKFLSRSSLAGDREDSAYRAALADYRAGRLDAAAEGFAKAIRRSPGNAEARFQYACLMQDTKKDYLEAFCAYREFLMQHPESDKARLAQDRLAICERELAKELAAKYKFSGGEAFAKEIAALREDVKAAETRATTAEKAAEEERARYQALESEHQRLVAVVKGTGAEEETAPTTKTVELKDILEEEDEEASAPTTSLAEAKALKDEESAETAGGSSLLPEQYAADREKRDAAKAQKAEQDRLAAERAKKDEAENAKRPKTYVVQDGDTLYKIALRFYGRVSAWRRIREANKVMVPPSGDVKAGQKLVLP